MNTATILVFLSISFLGMFIFWLLFRKANNTHSQAQKHLLTALQDKSLSQEDRKKHESQLSYLLQKNNSSGNLKVTLVLSVLLIPVSFALYLLLGSPQAINNTGLAATQNNQQQNQNQNQTQAPQLSMQDAIAQLEARLAQNPEDVDGQMLYARSQISLKNYNKALIAYRKSNELVPNEPVILTELAEAIALANNQRSFLGEPEGLLARAVELDPNNQKALWLLGMTFYEKKDYVKTNELWTNLYDLMNDDGAKKQLSEQLIDVRQQLKPPQISPQLDSNDAKDSIDDKSPTISLLIDVDKELLNRLDGKPAVLFIYSKAINGIPMPISVIKRPLNQIEKLFPMTLLLTDKNNMQANRNLSDFDNVKVGARISFSGNATPQSGDLQSEEIEIKVSSNNLVELIINKVR